MTGQTLTKRTCLAAALLALSSIAPVAVIAETIPETIPMWIGPHTRPCTAGVMPTRCMLVKWRADQKEWENFYARIEGFAPRAGYFYKIVVRRSAVANPPADAGSLRYELVKVVSHKKG